MKRILCSFLLMFAIHSIVSAQTEEPFIFNAYGGLFFPSQPHFQEVYQTSSDLLWGVGVCTPIGGSFYITSDLGYFRAEAFPGDVDTSIVLEERFIHAGILSKEHLTQGFFLRLSAGFSYATITRKTAGSSTTEVTLNADKKIGYYGGIGIEQLLDPHVSFFADVVYDYRRSRAQELSGDFGGTRLVIGLNLILF